MGPARLPNRLVRNRPAASQKPIGSTATLCAVMITSTTSSNPLNDRTGSAAGDGVLQATGAGARQG